MGEYGKDKLVIRKLLFDEKRITYVDSRVSCGLPNIEEDGVTESYFIWEHFLKKDDEAYIVETYGDSMVNAGIESGDRVVMRKKPTYDNNEIVLASLNGESLLKYLHKTENAVWLVAGNDNYKPIMVKPEDNLEIFGSLVQILKPAKSDMLKISKLILEEEKKLELVKESAPLPEELTTKNAKYQLGVLTKAKLLDEKWQRVKGVPIWQLGGIAEKLGQVLGIEGHFSYFGRLWKVNNASLCSKWVDAKGTEKEKNFRKNILDKLY